jgi:hypothetical protein
VDNGILLGIVGIIVTVVIGIGAYFVTNKKSKYVVKGNKTMGDIVLGDKTTTTINLDKEKDK